jgi:hypothetical protein
MKVSRAGELAARVELVNEALMKFVAILYENEGDDYPNIDIDGAIRVPVPWGSNGWKAWGLRYHEGRTLNNILRAITDEKRPRLFVYNEDTRRWFVNLSDYSALPAAMFWVQRNVITINKWRLATKV